MKPFHVVNMFLIFWHLKTYVLIWFDLIKNTCSTNGLARLDCMTIIQSHLQLFEKKASWRKNNLLL